jgi:hypothetical protein
MSVCLHLPSHAQSTFNGLRKLEKPVCGQITTSGVPAILGYLTWSDVLLKATTQRHLTWQAVACMRFLVSMPCVSFCSVLPLLQHCASSVPGDVSA